MIVSQIFALLGFYKAAHYRAEWPYVVPIHVLMYTVHMLQEHFDIYKKENKCVVASAGKDKEATKLKNA